MAMFPAKGTFILEICPSFYSVDGTIRELRAHVEEVVEYDSFQAVIRVKLEQLHCSTLVLVPMDFLSFSDRQQLLRLWRRVMVIRSLTRLPPSEFCLLFDLVFLETKYSG